MSTQQPYQDPERLDIQSASQLEIVVECPGMINLRNSIPKEELEKARSKDDDEFASSGTRLHHAWETNNTLKLSPDEHKTYEQGLRYQESILQKWIADKALDPARVVEGPRELRVYLHSQRNPLEVIGSGMLDRHWIYHDPAENRGLVLIIDWKGGWNPNLPVSARSWQLREQLICLWREEYSGITEGRVAYVKAKDKHEFGDFCDYNEADLKFSWESIQFHSYMSQQPDAPRHAGRHCRWCACKAYCREAVAMALLPSTMASTRKNGRKIEVEMKPDVTPDDLRKLYDYSTVIGKILEEVRNRLKSFSAEQLAAIGLMHGKPRPITTWNNAKGAFDFLIAQGWSEEDVWKCADFIWGRMVETAARQSNLTEEQAKATLQEDLKEFFTVTEGEKGIKLLR